MASPETIALAQQFSFEPSSHTYYDEHGEVVRSVTQVLTASRVIDYSMVPPDVLAHAAWRGNLVHQATCLIDQGEDENDYDIPEECQPYVRGYRLFQQECGFALAGQYNEFQMLGEAAGIPLAGTLDRLCLLFGNLTLLEIKNTACAHPSWGLQTSAYAHLVQQQDRALRHRHISRAAVQLKPNGAYKLHPYDDPGDFDTFCAALRLVAWKEKYGLPAAD